MSWITISRITKLGLTNFWRNRWLSLASTLIMTLTLLIITMFVVLTIVIGKTTDRIKSKMDVSIYFKDSATTEEITDVQTSLASRGDVKEVKYISKEEALQIWNESQKNERIKELIKPEDNPLPRSLEIKATDPSKLQDIASYIENNQTIQPLVHKVSYEDNKEVIDRLLAITSFVKKLGGIMSITFIIVSILVILNTIRLAIYSRKDEIEIMRLVGASDRFIRVPFIVEGLMYGILASLLAYILMWAGIGLVVPLTNRYLSGTTTVTMTDFFLSRFFLLFFMQFLVGILIGVACSLISIRKYLKI